MALANAYCVHPLWGLYFRNGGWDGKNTHSFSPSHDDNQFAATSVRQDDEFPLNSSN